MISRYYRYIMIYFNNINGQLNYKWTNVIQQVMIHSRMEFYLEVCIGVSSTDPVYLIYLTSECLSINIGWES